MKVHSIVDEALGNTSYLVEAGDGCAVSIDPRRDAGDHLDLATRLGVRIVAVLETHLHADFVSGAREIAAATGAEIVGATRACLAFPHRGVGPSDRLRFGHTTFDVVATPGHTPEHLAYLASDPDGLALFSGGSLIAGGAARTDLSGADQTEELTRAQYASLRALASLPDETMLYPTHGGGSFCSAGSARAEARTIGDERATNPLLAAGSEESFAETLRLGFGSYPRYFGHLREVNRLGAPLRASLPPVRELSGTEAHEAAATGAWLIDGRRVEDWARSHATGAISIAVRPAFASWLGWVVPFGARLVLMLESGQLAEAVDLAHRIGYDAIEGWVTFGSWRDAALPVSSVEEIDPAEAAARARAGAVLLDVRQADEFRARHAEGAVHIELGDVIAGKTPDAAAIVTYCGHGERSATAASLLERRGLSVANLRGGIAAWRSAGLPLEE